MLLLLLNSQCAAPHQLTNGACLSQNMRDQGHSLFSRAPSLRLPGSPSSTVYSCHARLFPFARRPTPPPQCVLCVCRAEFLSKFVPLPSPNVPSCVGVLVERMAARLLTFFVRHASLVRVCGLAGGRALLTGCVCAATLVASVWCMRYACGLMILPSPPSSCEPMGPPRVGLRIQRTHPRLLASMKEPPHPPPTLPCGPQVRPLSQTGKLQLAKDMAELQLAVGSALYPLEQLGQPYRWGGGRGRLERGTWAARPAP